VTDVHLESDLGLTAVTTKMTLANEHSEQKARLETVQGVRIGHEILVACFTG
jgi:hypothetical protein